MSRRSQREAALVETAVKAAAEAAATAKAVVSREDAEELVEQRAWEREQKRRGRLRYRLRRHLYPWKAAAALLATAGLLWLLRFTGAGVVAIVATLAVLAVGGLAWWWMKRAGRWATRVCVGGAAGAGWLIIATVAGLSWLLLLLLVLGTVCVSTGYWRTLQLDSGADDERRIRPASVPILWRKWVSNPNGALPESQLIAPNPPEPDSNLISHDVQMRRGRETHATALSRLDQIASGLDVPIRNLVLEPHPNESPSQMRLTVVKKSPIANTVAYTGPRTSGGVILPGAYEDPSVPLPEAALIDIGPYADAKGYAPWRIWTPGEVLNGGSAWGGFIGGGMGVGKSRTLELICIGAMSFGWVETWFLDPQNGASSPALRDAADWYGDLSDAGDLLDALEGFISMRGMEMGDQGWIGYDPSPERPLLNVVIDECHEVFGPKPTVQRWGDVTRKIRKVGGSITALSQNFGLKTFGGLDELRSSVFAGNVIAMRSESKHQGQMVPGLDLNPLSLPALPGYGYTVARGGSSARTAPYRAEYVKDPAAWLRMFPGPGLDRIAAAGAGEKYLNRDGAAELKRTGLRETIELVMSGGKLPSRTQDRPAEPADDKASSGTWFKAVNWGKPRLVVDNTTAGPAVIEEVTGDTARERILSYLQVHGVGQKGELIKAANKTEPRVRQVLDDLMGRGLVERTEHGWYRLTPRNRGAR